MRGLLFCALHVSLDTCTVQYMSDPESALVEWASIAGDRDNRVRRAIANGVTKNRIHTITGISRATIDRILKEPAMTTTTALITSAALSGTTHENGWFGFINGGDYTETQQAKLVENLMTSQEAQFDLSLPDECYWQPETSSIIGPVGTDLSEYDIDELLTAASDWVIDHFAEVEQAAIVGAAEIDPDDQS